MSIMRNTPYNHSFNDLIIAKVQALNAIGWSDESNINGIAVAKV